MVIELKPLYEQVIVITGASSGIGLATVESAAQQGAKLVLAARSEETLNDIARWINTSGGDMSELTLGLPLLLAKLVRPLTPGVLRGLGRRRLLLSQCASAHGHDANE